MASCIADGPFTAHLSMACGHTAKKGCRRCFIVGQTKDGGESLGGTRFLGYNEPTDFESFDREGAWNESRASYKALDGSYDSAMATTFTLSEAQHQARVSCAEKISVEKERECPIPQAREGTTPELLRRGDVHTAW
jgi:hypothetical protein